MFISGVSYVRCRTTRMERGVSTWPFKILTSVQSEKARICRKSLDEAVLFMGYTGDFDVVCECTIVGLH